MKSIYYFISLSFLGACLIACSPIDSVRPFDQTQAAVLVKHMQAKQSKKSAGTAAEAKTSHS